MSCPDLIQITRLHLVMATEKNCNSQLLTSLLLRWRAGDVAAGDQLMDVTYAELRKLAARYMRSERRGHTLQATALIHELYIRLFAAGPVQWENRTHFFAVAARQLRRIVVNYARDRQAAKRGGKQARLSLSDVSLAVRTTDVLEVDEALRRLEQLDSRAAEVVELRYFGGLTETEAAEAIGISVATLRRDWDFARAWLVQQLK